jgi:phi LC3 family holin
MKQLLKNTKFRNPIFWISIVSIIFASAGVDFTTLTSWELFGKAVMNIFNNPVSITTVIVAMVGVFNDNSTKGIDSLSNKKMK